ncbi:hypothetical protein DL96DRAFT_1474439, partial [Flagelloscypha sp. PMI_526]
MNVTNPSSLSGLRILSQNLRKSQIAQLALLNSEELNEYQIVCLQEPYINVWNNNTTSHANWEVIYLTERKRKPKDKYCSVILVKKSLASDLWKEIELEGSMDVTAIKVETDEEVITILNVYNDCTNDDSLKTIEEFSREE